VLHICTQRRLEPERLSGAHIETGDGGVDRTVEHEPSGLFWIQVRVRRTEEGAVRVSEVVQLLVTKYRADDIHIARGIDRCDEGQNAAAVRLARFSELRVAIGELVFPFLAPPRVLRNVIEVGIHLFSVEAAYRRGFADA